MIPPKNRRTTIKFPVFNGYEVRVILASDMVRTGRRMNQDLTGCIAALLTDPKKEKVCWMVLGPKGRNSDTISHEASHAIKALFKCTGVKMDEEAFAYHLGYLVGKVHNFLDQGKS